MALSYPQRVALLQQGGVRGPMALRADRAQCLLRLRQPREQRVQRLVKVLRRNPSKGQLLEMKREEEATGTHLTLHQRGVKPRLPALQRAARSHPTAIGRAEPRLQLPQPPIVRAAAGQVERDQGALVYAERPLRLLPHKKKQSQRVRE